MVRQHLFGERVVLLAALCSALVGGYVGPTLQSAGATDRQWTWMKGGATGNEAGVYGTITEPAAANTPGARQAAVSWTDPSGGLWLFGGVGLDAERDEGYLNDLWKYDRSAGNWTWMTGASTRNEPGNYGELGVPDGKNCPGARYDAVSWTDQSGNLWLFGGYGYAKDGATTGRLNDLWVFDGKGWTWMKGADVVNQPGKYGELNTPDRANTPGARSGAVSWTDPWGELWIFGGVGYDGEGNEKYLNDVWSYNLASGNWIWRHGPSTGNGAGVYGEISVPDPANTPGARYQAVAWFDATGMFWLFGGYGYDGGGNQGELNDLWMFDLQGVGWTWIKGTTKRNQPGIYGDLEIPAAENTPGGRQGSVGWMDPAGYLWLFGGMAWDSTGTDNDINDLWRYDLAKGDWTWMKGSNEILAGGKYGTFRTPDPGNTPGARSEAVSWIDPSGALWFFGGEGQIEEKATWGLFNDLWRWQDGVKPTGTILVNNNRSVTNNAKVTLSLTWSDGTDDGSGVVRMKFSNDAVTWTAWEPLAATKAWTMLPGDGYKTVRVMYRDKAGNNSPVYHDYIRLDTSPPTGSIIINGGAASTTSRNVSLGLAWNDGTGSGVSRMRFSIDGSHWSAWEMPVTPRSYTLPATPQYYTVRVQYLDAGNNYSPVYNDYIKLVAP